MKSPFTATGTRACGGRDGVRRGLTALGFGGVGGRAGTFLGRGGRASGAGAAASWERMQRRMTGAAASIPPEHGGEEGLHDVGENAFPPRALPDARSELDEPIDAEPPCDRREGPLADDL